MSWGDGTIRHVHFRFCDIPDNVRFAAARREIRKAPDEAEELLLAALRPSAAVYRLPGVRRAMVESLTRRAA